EFRGDLVGHPTIARVGRMPAPDGCVAPPSALRVLPTLPRLLFDGVADHRRPCELPASSPSCLRSPSSPVVVTRRRAVPLRSRSTSPSPARPSVSRTTPDSLDTSTRRRPYPPRWVPRE